MITGILACTWFVFYPLEDKLVIHNLNYGNFTVQTYEDVENNMGKDGYKGYELYIGRDRCCYTIHKEHPKFALDLQCAGFDNDEDPPPPKSSLDLQKAKRVTE